MVALAVGGRRRSSSSRLLLVPWDPVPGGTPASGSGASVGLHRRSRSPRAEDFARWARVWGWSSLAVSLAVACGLGFTPAGPPARRPAAGPVVGAGRARGRRARAGRPARHPAVRGRCCARHLLDYGLSTQSWGRAPSTVLKGEAGGHGGHLARAARAGRLRPALAARLAGRRRRASWRCSCCWVRSSTRCSSSRSSTTSPRCRTGRCAPRSSSSPTQEGVAVDDVLVADASRRTTTLNAYVSGFGEHPPGRRLRQPGRRPAARTRRCRSSPTSWPTPSTTTWSPARCSGAAGAVLGVGLLAAGRRGSWPASGAGRRWPTPRSCRWSWRWSRWRPCVASPVQNGDQPADRDPGRRGRAAGDRRPGRVRRRCSGSWRCGRSATRRRRPGRSSGSAATRPGCTDRDRAAARPDSPAEPMVRSRGAVACTPDERPLA